MNFAYAMSMNLFPVFSGLKEKTNKNMVNVVTISSSYASFLYVLTGMVGIMMFGRTVGLDSNIIKNVGYEY
jgi:amino acid permease